MTTRWTGGMHPGYKSMLPVSVSNGRFVQIDCAHIISPAQKCQLPNLYFRFPCLSNSISALLPFRYPMKLDTLIFSEMLANICTVLSSNALPVSSHPYTCTVVLVSHACCFCIDCRLLYAYI